MWPLGKWYVKPASTVTYQALPGYKRTANDNRGQWLTKSGIINVAQLEITAAPGVFRLQRREEEVFRA
jgi:hypothetical protein